MAEVSTSAAHERPGASPILFGTILFLASELLFFGGLFLLWKSSQEMYHALEGEDETHDEPKGAGGNHAHALASPVFRFRDSALHADNSRATARSAFSRLLGSDG